MSKPKLRILLTILMYAGVVLFLVPYVNGRASLAITLLIAGAGLTAVSGMLRCLLTEGDCSERMHVQKPAP